MWDKIQHSDNTILCTKENAKRFKHVKAFAHKFLEGVFGIGAIIEINDQLYSFSEGILLLHLVFYFCRICCPNCKG